MKAPIIAVALLATLAGCAVQPNSANVYNARQAQNEQSVRMGTVESVREVTIDKGETGTGVLAGAALGGVAGSAVGWVGGSKNVVSDRLVQRAKRCMVSSVRPWPLRTTASGLPR